MSEYESEDESEYEYESEYDLRQYRHMLERVEKPISSLRRLLKVINDLEALRDVLEEKDQEWLSQFTHHWWVLEKIYAYYSNLESDRIGEAYLKEIEETRGEIIALVELKIKELDV